MVSILEIDLVISRSMLLYLFAIRKVSFARV